MTHDNPTPQNPFSYNPQGQQLPPQAPPPPQGYGPAPQMPPQPPKKSSKGCLIAAIVVAVFALVMIAGVIGLVVYVGKQYDQVVTPSVSTSAPTTASPGAGAPIGGMDSDLDAAVSSAQNYSEFLHLSKKEIYNLLVTQENFSTETAQQAVDSLNVDWRNNALEQAKTYAETLDMSPEEIYEQLVNEYGGAFTPEEARYAVDNLNK